MQQIRKWLMMAVIPVAALYCTACGIISTQKVTRGQDIASSDVNALVKGQTTEKEVIKLFGPPTKVKDSADGGKEYLYEYASAGGLKWNLLVSVGGGTKIKSLLVWIDKNDVVTDYAYKVS